MNGYSMFMMAFLAIGAFFNPPPSPSGTSAAVPPALIVTIRDTVGHGVPHVQVHVLDDRGITVLRQEVTDIYGVASIGNIPVDVVRVRFNGSLSDGVVLLQQGADALGILVMLNPTPPTHLDMRVEPSGQIIPDPVTMIVPDTGIHTEKTDLPPIPFADLPGAPPIAQINLTPTLILYPTLVVGMDAHLPIDVGSTHDQDFRDHDVIDAGVMVGMFMVAVVSVGMGILWWRPVARRLRGKKR